MCPDDFARVIGRETTLQAVTVEVAKDAPLVTLLPFDAGWLREIRAEQGESYSGGPYFKVNRQAQIETATIKAQPARP